MSANTRTEALIAEPVLRRPATPRWLAELAMFSVALRFDDLPAAVVARTKQVIADSIAAIATGAQEPEIISLAARLMRAKQGVTPAIGLNRRTDAQTAALLGGTAGTMLELDEGNQYARGHPGIHVVPAVLAAAAEARATGQDIITAIALGYDIGARIGIASKLRITMHPHGTWGTVGAAVAIARLHGATADQMIEVINVASTLGLATSRRTMLEGGTIRNAYAGLSNQIGLMAWDMVSAGFTGEADGLSTIYGTVIADHWQPEEMTRELGQRWEIARNYFKRHACCRYNHGALDALQALRTLAGGSLQPETIARIDVATYVWAAQLASQQPHNMLAAKFSLPYSIATTIVHGAATIAAFRDTARGDPAIQSLAQRVFVVEDTGMTAQLPRLRPARVTITMTDGRSLTAATETNKGDTEDPYSADEVRDKFVELSTPVYGRDVAAAILAAVDALDRAPGIHALEALL